MAGKRRAYAVTVDCPEQNFSDSLCYGRDGEPAIYGNNKQAEETVAYLKSVVGAVATYTITKVELK